MNIHFRNLIANEKTRNQIALLMQSDRMSHAIVTEGDEGLGKHALAYEIAGALVCRSDEKPCYSCAQCKKAIKRIHPDIFEYTAQGGARSFHVETVRQVIDDVYMQPNESDYKIYILGNAHLMSDSAQNAILKVLEEPPEYALFILTTTNKSALLPTVLSRSVVFSMEGVPFEDGARYITEHDSDIDYDSALEAISAWNGNIGQAMESLKDGSMAQWSSLCREICLALTHDNEYSLLCASSAFQKDRQGLTTVCTLLKNIFRDALIYAVQKNGESDGEDAAKQLASRLTKEKLLKLIAVVDEIKKEAQMNANNTLISTKFCYALRRAAGR